MEANEGNNKENFESKQLYHYVVEFIWPHGRRSRKNGLNAVN